MGNLPSGVAYARHEAGDHVILVGEVQDAMTYDMTPLVYFNREFCDIERRLSRSRPVNP